MVNSPSASAALSFIVLLPNDSLLPAACSSSGLPAHSPVLCHARYRTQRLQSHFHARDTFRHCHQTLKAPRIPDRFYSSPIRHDLSYERNRGVRIPLTRTPIGSSGPTTLSTQSPGKTEQWQRQRFILGPTHRRNAFFRAIPFKYLRAHEAFYALPTSINIQLDDLTSLATLRQDCLPFLAAWHAFPMHVNEIWPLLGLDQHQVLSKQFGRSHRGRTHALKAWKSLLSGNCDNSLRKRSFRDRFIHEHVPNAVLSYISAEKRRWMQLSSQPPPWCEAVQLLETGCHVHAGTYFPIAAAPSARIIRRRENDFWMWGSEDAVLIAKAEHSFSESSGRECRFELEAVRDELDMFSWIEAQFSMLCMSPRTQLADVVWYAPSGGVSIFRVTRDDEFISAGLREMERFFVEFVAIGSPPSPRVLHVEDSQKIVSCIINGLENVTTLASVPKDVVEKELDGWRDQMNSWEQNRALKPFF